MAVRRVLGLRVGAIGLLALAAAACSPYGGTYVCDNHVDSSVDQIAFSGGKVTVTNYHVPDNKSEGSYKINGQDLTAKFKDSEVTGRFDGKGGLEIYGQVCKKK